MSDLASDASTTLLQLRERVEQFVQHRDWAQFHNPKDLAAAIAIEAAELMELFLWQTPLQVNATVQSPGSLQSIGEELSDVLILGLCLANRLEIDLSSAVARKLQLNEAKYPAELVRGRSDKYTHYLNGCTGMTPERDNGDA